MANWSLKGTYFESCNCEAACPCVFLSDPTYGDCTALVAWHIDEGEYDGVPLRGLNVVGAFHSPGNMAKVPWEAVLYLDADASAEQCEVLGRIFGGQAGGHPARLAQHIGKVLGVTQAPIDYRVEGGHRMVRFGDVGEMAISAIDGQGDEETSISGPPLAIAPGFPSVVARSERLRYRDQGFQWELSERNGFFSPFTYKGGS